MDSTSKCVVELARTGSSRSAGIHMGPEQIPHLRKFVARKKLETFLSGRGAQPITFSSRGSAHIESRVWPCEWIKELTMVMLAQLAANFWSMWVFSQTCFLVAPLPPCLQKH